MQLSVVVAGIVGSIVSMAFVRKLTPFGALMTIVVGAAHTFYLTPPLVEWFDLTPKGGNLAGFFIGFVAVNFSGGVFRFFELFRAKPLETINEIRKGKSRD